MSNHVTMRNEKLFCTNCGESHTLKFPISIPEINKKTNLFIELHLNCEKTWKEPKVDQNLSIESKAIWWVTNGETGLSSKAMWACFMNSKTDNINHPYDPDDFSRCYKLLETIPEWKNKLHKLKSLSSQWSNLVDNWDQLTQMYEKNVSENWRNSTQIGMYNFMQKLIK